MATAKRKQEELGEECDEQESHDNDPCSDEDDAKRPRLDLHLHHIPHHLDTGARIDPDPNHYIDYNYDYSISRMSNYNANEMPCDLSNWQVRSMDRVENNMADEREIANASGSLDSEQDNFNSDNADDSQPINFAYYHF
ncbi:unnamed protein product [Parnassius apollo]|uniref:(apollo) hypothetical protein n=1 Tax=Parnassius apollo TaxID=110799 RepID=A0A8S3WZR8_PARAO|nr:unnamed protein product [Parnassius apollo]